jgi:hypothetical protein
MSVAVVDNGFNRLGERGVIVGITLCCSTPLYITITTVKNVVRVTATRAQHTLRLLL